MHWLIWSKEHKAWWAAGSQGYVQDRREAGRYTLEKATRIVIDANKYSGPLDIPEEAMVPEEEGEK